MEEKDNKSKKNEKTGNEVPDENRVFTKEEKKYIRDHLKIENEELKKRKKAIKIATKQAKKELKQEKKEQRIAESKGKDKSTKQSSIGKKIAFIAVIVLIILVLGAIGYVVKTIINKQQYVNQNPVATIEIKDYGTVKIELYPEYAPNTVANFIALANNGFYNGLTFHRTIPNFMVQGGDPNGDGTGNAKLSNLGQESTDTYAITGEFVLNGFTQNTLRHKRGVISMARSDYSSYSSSLAKKGYDSASCQFFIMTTDNSNLDGSYAAFGEVTEGMDIIDKISNLEVETRDTTSTTSGKTADRPINPPVMTSVTVETYGVDYGAPETIKPFDYYSYMMQQYYGSSSAN